MKKLLLYKFIPFLLIIISVFGYLLILKNIENTYGRTITITALNQRNRLAKGSEIWLKNIIVDGKEVEVKNIFSRGWIAEKEYLKWRPYNNKNIKSSISANFSKNSNIKLVFDTNIYRGKVEIRDGFKVFVVDCYQNNKYGCIKTYDLDELEWKLRIPGKIMFILINSLLCFFASIFIFLTGMKQGEDYKIKNISFGPRETWIDVLKTISAFMVVLIHTVGPAYHRLQIGSTEWLYVLFLNVLPRFAVPVFMMISGILILNKELSLKKVKRNIIYSIVLLLLWNVCYILLDYVLFGKGIDILEQILFLPIQKGPSGHLWYAYFIVWLYVFSPILVHLYKVLTLRQKWYFCFITLCFPSIIDLYAKIIVQSSGVVSTTSIFMTLNYIGLLFLGRTIYDSRAIIRNMFKVGSVSALIGMSGMIYFTYNYGIKFSKVTDQYCMETHFFAVLYAVGILIVAIRLSECKITLPETLKKLIFYIASYSLGIYFIHCIVLWTLGNIEFQDIFISRSENALSALICCTIYYFISIMWIFLISKIPVLKHIVR